MKTYSSAAIAAIVAGETIGVGALKISTTPDAFRVWGGYGDVTIDGETYTGIGDRTLVNTTGGSLGTAAQDTTITLSGVDPDALSLVDLADVRGAPALLYRLTFDGSGRTLLDYKVHLRGRCDTLSREDTPAGAAKLILSITGSAAGLGRNLSRRRTDADQRLISGTDSGMKHVSYAGVITLAWGGKAPAPAASVLPNSVSSGTGAGAANVAFNPNDLKFNIAI